MDVESRLDKAFELGASGVQPDVSAALREVRGRARRRTTRGRITVVAAVAGVLLAAGVTAKLAAPGGGRSEAPVSPSGEDGSAGSVSISVTKRVNAGSLGLRKLLSVAVSPQGRVYVTDTSQRVAELTPDLELVRAWGGTGAGPGRFRLVQGSLAVGPDGSVYVSDTGNFRVQVFTPAGRYVRSIGEFGNGPGQFTWPFDVAVDGDGNVYVADDKEQTLAKLTPSGRQLWRRGGLGETDPLLQGHEHLSMLDGQGRLLTTNDDRGKVLRLDPDGSVADVLSVTRTGPDGVCDATVDSSDRFYLTSCFAPSGVQVYTADGKPLTTWTGPGLVQSPRWAPDGTGYAVTADGGLVSLRVATD
jgi:sugar lactone lactonase YvrE